MKPEVKFRSSLKKNYVYITYYCGLNEIKFHFGGCRRKTAIKKCKQTKRKEL